MTTIQAKAASFSLAVQTSLLQCEKIRLLERRCALHPSRRHKVAGGDSHIARSTWCASRFHTLRTKTLNFASGFRGLRK